METIAYTGAVLTGFMISQTYNYFFGGSSSGSDGSVSGTTNINIHTHHHTSPPVKDVGNTNANTNTNVNTNANSSVTIPKSLLYDIQVFPNDELKPIQMRSGSGSGSGSYSSLNPSSCNIPRLTMEDELIERLKAIRRQVQDDDLH